ncbi:glycolate oxidase FAD binding subunit [Tistlia consotensis]|uniref:Glycolate oxidase FAD binding subunit n=1 Tax=Tistlia consotensis USBA 355 TaxID=560819 RepID=A0A1Y6B8S8_9PROT|nr:glycolate oxidase subunit GlcE [Tistlia consotensis]SME91447.1 glycolate oxidase FAD binding subunit [Tistlia consotensis USBA 355]SNR27387.1 glycolate oxidase FAD binding subunit [Tistlia consotensis]
MSDSWKPTDDAQVLEAVAWASAEEVPLEIVGQGSKRSFGRPLQCERDLDLSGLSGITLYEPGELVLSAKAGTALSEIRAALEDARQELAFEPPDLAPFFGRPAGAGTLGGTIAANLSGPRRINAGAARDHFLGFQAVSGRGERFKSGGRVMKNVTGYDLPKLLAGSFGTLAVMTDVTVKVLPAPEKQRTVLLFGLDDAAAVAALSAALGSPHEVSGAAHLPAAVAAGSSVDFVAGAGTAVTAIRLEGHGPSVEARCAALREALAAGGPAAAAQEELHSQRSRTLWREIAELAPFVVRPELAVWRISVAPSEGPKVAATLADLPEMLHYFDWGGGLLWLGTAAGGTAEEVRVRGAVATVGGHATLLRAPARVRLAVPVFQPLDAARAALSRRVKEGFDPRRILNPGRMVPEL